MKLPTTASALAQLLGQNLNKEFQRWKPIVYKQTDRISGKVRDDVVMRMIYINSKLNLHPETVGSAVAILDKFLSLVKVPCKYLRCVITTCIYLAAKTLEEDHLIPSTIDIVRTSECGCSLSEITRMELTILKKLNWSLPTTSSIDSLHIIYSVLLQHHPHLLVGLKDMTPSRHMNIIVKKLISCLGEYRLLTFRPMTVAVSMLSLELENMIVGWFPITSILLKLTKIETQDLIRCREIIAQHLASRHELTTPYQKVSPQKSKKRKVEQIDEEDDDIYDSIKRLYNEDYVTDLTPTRGSCGSQVQQNIDGELFAPVQTVCAN